MNQPTVREWKVIGSLLFACAAGMTVLTVLFSLRVVGMATMLIALCASAVVLAVVAAAALRRRTSG